MGTHKQYHIQGKKGSYFRDQLRGVDLEQVLIVAIDAAKLHQKALICNYFGDVIEKSFFFSVNHSGIDLLCAKIEKSVTMVNAQRIFIGVEATGHYYEDIVRELGSRGYRVDIFNAYTTKEERNSALNWCKTDDLDLIALAHAIKNNKGTESTLLEGKQRQLLTLTRTRRKEINRRSSLLVEIRTLMDHIWREFQGYAIEQNGKRKTQKIFSDFWGKSSLFFMEHYPHPSDILSLGELGLKRLSKEHNLKLRAATIQRLLFAAEQAITRSKEELAPEFLVLKMRLQDHKKISENIKTLEREIEKILLQTDGKLLLTVPGIGLVSAAEFYAELGNTSNYDNPGQLIKKAGTNPIIEQSGGDEGHRYYGRISRQGNPHLRHVVYHIGFSLSTHNKDLQPFKQRLKEKGKHSRKVFIAIGNKFIKIAFAMLRDQKPFLSKQPDFHIIGEINKKLKYSQMCPQKTESKAVA